MGEHLVFERYIWFDRQIQAGRFPNAATLAAEFEISERTARRNIHFMRDHFDAPLEYNSSRKGFRYTDRGFSLPACRLSQKEMLAVLLAGNLLSSCAGGIISDTLDKMVRKIACGTEPSGLTEARLQENFSAVWHGYSPSQSKIFRLVSSALVTDRRIRFNYSSPLGPRSSRCVEPHHLQHYMGNWILLAWCLRRRDWRKFHLARMSGPKVDAAVFTPRPREEWSYLLDTAFGIFQGRKTVPVVLRFSPEQARWVRERVYHPDQTMKRTGNGGLILTLPVADFREIKQMILQFGSEVEVLEPMELREQIHCEAERLLDLYRRE